MKKMAQCLRAASTASLWQAMERVGTWCRSFGSRNRRHCRYQNSTWRN